MGTPHSLSRGDTSSLFQWINSSLPGVQSEERHLPPLTTGGACGSKWNELEGVSKIEAPALLT